MDEMFPRSRLGRIQDPFTGFGTHFDFPQFGTLGRRRAAAGQPTDPHASMGHDDNDFFNRLPSEFRQYMPDGFGHTRRSAAASSPPLQNQSHYMPQPQPYYAHPSSAATANGTAQSPSKTLCDAAIQTEESSAGGGAADQLNQHTFRNTVDMGVKSMPENMEQEHRSHSAPPNEQMQHKHHHQPQPSKHMNGKRVTPPPGGAGQHGTQTSPQAGVQTQEVPFHKSYYAPQQHAYPQQKQQTPPPTQSQPQTPGGTYVRTIPIFVEGRSEPIINSHKEIPNQNAASGAGSASSTHRGYGPQQHYQQPQQQQQQPQSRPTPLNTQHHAQQQQPQQNQQQQQQGSNSGTNLSGAPPQTPHTMDSINKIQDIQRDVLDLMAKVEKFRGKRQDKEYVYLDEMLTRNLLKLDTIDTNGKESIRLARKEAIKCIQASINVLEAKAEENARIEAEAAATTASQQEDTSAISTELTEAAEKLDVTKEIEGEQRQPEEMSTSHKEQYNDATKIMEPIPLPPPENLTSVLDNTQDISSSNLEAEKKENGPAAAVQQPAGKRDSPPRQEEIGTTRKNSRE